MMIEVKTFSQNFEELYGLIRDSWVEDYTTKYHQPVQDFSIDFLSWNLTKPNSDPDLLLTAYLQGDLVGFAAAIPHELICGSNILRATLSTFFTTRSGFKGKGVGKALARERIRRIKEKGYDINYFAQDEGHSVESLMSRVSADMGESLIDFYRFTFLSKPLDQEKVARIIELSSIEKIALPFISHTSKTKINGTHKLREADIKKISESFLYELGENEISVFYHASDIKREYQYPISGVNIHSNGKQIGAILYYHIDLVGNRANANPAKICMIDYFVYQKMSVIEKYNFIKKFCSEQKELGCCLITYPTSPSTELLPFYANLFIPSGRYHTIRGFDFNGNLPAHFKAKRLMFR